MVAQLECKKEVVSRTGELSKVIVMSPDTPRGQWPFGAHHQSAPWTRWEGSSGGRTSWEERHEKTSGEALSSRTL